MLGISETMVARGHREALFVLLLAAVVAGACARTGGSPAGQVMGPAGCLVRETSRTPLLIDGNRELYVEPTVVLPSDGSILLAGRPNYLYSAGSATDERTYAQDSVFGAVLDRSGRARLIPAPIDPALVSSTHALPLAGGGWAVVFAEMKRPWVPPRKDTIVGLWYGEFDGARWSALERLPDIPGGTYDLDMGSALIPRGDTLFTAALVRTDTNIASVVVFERLAGRWTSEIVDARAASYAELFYSDSLGLLMAVVQADHSLRADANSLLLYGPRPRWEILRKVIHGGSQPVYDPLFSASPEGTVLSWWVMDRVGGARRARAMVGLTPDRDGRVAELDPDVNHVTPVVGHPRFPIWLSEHNTPAGERELRFLADSAGHARQLAALANPFTGPFAATAVGASDLLVSGPLLRADPKNPSLVSLIIRARVECRTSAP
jgi:hypothetical protein